MILDAPDISEIFCYNKKNENPSWEEVYDFQGKQQIEGGGETWLGNRYKVLYVFKRTKKYLKPKMHVCEIGFGEGYLLLLLKSSGLNLKIVGIDISEYLVMKLSRFKSYGIDLIKHDISKPVNEDLVQRFDIVFALDVLEHIKDLDKAIENIHKLLKPYGFLIATVPWKENLADKIVICPFCHHVFHVWGHYHSFHSMDDVHRMLGKHFKIIEYDFPSLTLEENLKTLLKKTIFRRKYYKDGLPNFQTTLFFVAQKI